MSYPVLYKGGTGEITEKKSRFIATVFPVETAEEAEEYIESVRKKYYDARHNCFAYIVGEKNETIRSSDDGEPQGTAGHPILNVLQGADVHNVLVVVTRYFGGTLLGKGGLVRAYSEAAGEGLKNSIIIEKCRGKKVSIITDYRGVGKLQYIMAVLELTGIETRYEEKVSVILLVPEEKLDMLQTEVTEATAGKAKLKVLEDIYYGVLDKEVVYL